MIQAPFSPFMPNYTHYFPFYPPHMPPYLQHAPLPPSTPTAPRISHPISSPIDVVVYNGKDVSAYINWMIKNNPSDIEALKAAKEVLIAEMVDLDILKTMSKEDCIHWDIKWGLGKRIMRDIKKYIHES